jgi:hypothetical protein
METSAIRDWGDAVLTSLGGALMLFMAAIPRIIGFLLILAIGWFVASLVARGVAALLRAIDLDRHARRAGFDEITRRMGVRSDAAGFVALIAKWFVRLITLVVAFDALGVPAVSEVLRQLVMWLPDLVVAMLVLVAGGVAAGALANLVGSATARAGLANPKVMATVARVAVWSFAILVAVNQIGVGTTLVQTLFMAVVGAVALAVGLAFGLGGRETAGRVVADWYASSKDAATRLAAEEAARVPMEGVDYGPPAIERRRSLSSSYTGIERRRGLA